MDPLSILRDYTKNGKNVVFDAENGEFIFDNVRHSKDALTTFKSKRGEGTPYTLGAVWFLLQHAEKKYGDYVTLVREHQFPLISLVDKKDLIAYLRGEIDTCASIQVLPAIPMTIDDVPEDRSHTDRANKKAKTDYQDMMNDDTIQKEKEEFGNRLDRRQHVDADSKSEKADIGGLDVEAIKQKRKKVKEQSVSQNASDDLEAPKLGKFVELDAKVTKGILENEKPLFTRTSILQTRNRRTFNNLIDLATSTLKKDDQKRKAEHAQRRSGYDRYQDVEDKKFWADRLKGNDTLDFQIDTRGTFASAPGGTTTDSIPLPKPPKVTRPTSSPSSSIAKQASDSKEQIPLIIVPSAITSPITLYNIKEFLQDGVHISTVEKKNSGVKKGDMVIVERKKGNSVVHYQIIDNTTKMTTKDWNRLVGVFVLGQAWQFKGWRWDNPGDIFGNVTGYFLKYEDEKIPDAIKDWPIKILTISKLSQKKHLTQAAVREFWDSVDQFVLTKRPNVKH